MTLVEIGFAVIVGLLGVVNMWFWFDKNRGEDDRKSLWIELNELKKTNATFMTRPEVKEMMNEALAPVKEEQIKSLSIMRSIESMLRKMETEFAVTKYALFNRGLNEPKDIDS
jgi:hypothetical protein